MVSQSLHIASWAFLFLSKDSAVIVLGLQSLHCFAVIDTDKAYILLLSLAVCDLSKYPSNYMNLQNEHTHAFLLTTVVLGAIVIRSRQYRKSCYHFCLRAGNILSRLSLRLDPYADVSS